jgi:hypothetical protein
MKIKKRGAIETSTLTKIILAMVFFVVIVIFFSNALGLLDKTTADQKCRITVFAQQLKPTGTSLISLSCPRHNLKVSDSGIQIQEKDKWKPVTAFEKPLAKDTKQFYKLAADEMADCWNKMGEGKVNVFNKDFTTHNYYRLTCLICSNIQFNRSPDLPLGTTDDFVKYLKENYYTKNGKNATYYNYMLMEYAAQQNAKFNPLDFYIQAEKSIHIYGFDTDKNLNTKDNYIIFFKAIKFSQTADLIGDLFKKLSEDEKKSFMRYDDAYYIFFAKPETVPKVCEILIN